MSTLTIPIESLKQRATESLCFQLVETLYCDTLFLFERVGDAVQASIYMRHRLNNEWQEKRPILADRIFIVSGVEETPLTQLNPGDFNLLMTSINGSEKTLHIQSGHHEGWPTPFRLLIEESRRFQGCGGDCLHRRSLEVE